jgi:hypothetical protein
VEDSKRAHLATTEETMTALGVDNREQLDPWARDGFPTPDGTRLPLRRKRFKDGTPGGRTHWLRRHVRAIRPYRAGQKRDNPKAVFEPFEHEGVTRLRMRAVLSRLRKAGVPASKQTLWDWENDRLDVVKVPSICSCNPTEDAANENQLDRIISAYAKPADEYDRADFFLDEDGVRFLPQHLAIRYLNYNEIIRDNKRPEEQRLIATRRETLPWRPNRPKRVKQRLYSEASLLKHPKALRSTSWFDENGNGHVDLAQPAQTAQPRSGTTSAEEPAPLHDTARDIAAYVRENPGCTAAQIGRVVNTSEQNVRRIFSRTLNKLGFTNPRGGTGYFPPAKAGENGM